jgi:hypothetical protein
VTPKPTPCAASNTACPASCSTTCTPTTTSAKTVANRQRLNIGDAHDSDSRDQSTALPAAGALVKFWRALTHSSPVHLVDLASAAEEAGFDGVTVADHLFVPQTVQTRYPYSSDGQVPWDLDAPWPGPVARDWSNGGHHRAHPVHH